MACAGLLSRGLSRLGFSLQIQFLVTASLESAQWNLLAHLWCDPRSFPIILLDLEGRSCTPPCPWQSPSTSLGSVERSLFSGDNKDNVNRWLSIAHTAGTGYTSFLTCPWLLLHVHIWPNFPCILLLSYLTLTLYYNHSICRVISHWTHRWYTDICRHSTRIYKIIF